MVHPFLRRVHLPALLGVIGLLILVQLGTRREARAPSPADPTTATPAAPRPGPTDDSIRALETRLSALRADADRDPARRDRMLRLAERRREAFLLLMERDPAAALERALPLHEFAALPEELRPYFERPLSGIGSIELTWESTPQDDGTLACRHLNTLHLGGQTYIVQDPHSGPPRRPQKNVPVSGIALGQSVVLAPSAVRPLPPEEIASAGELFPPARSGHLDPLTGEPVSSRHAALIAGRVHRFQSPHHVTHVSRHLLAAAEEAREEDRYEIRHGFDWLAANDGGEGDDIDDDPAGLKTPFMDDTIDVLFIRVDFSDFPGAPISQGDLESTLTTVKGHVEDFSYDQATIVPTVTPTVYRMPNTGASYAVAGDNNGLHQDARNLAAAHYNLANYDVVGVFFPNLGGVSGSQITYGGRASIGGSNHWINGVNNVHVVLHEFGHNYGLYHSNYWDPGESIGGRYDVPGSLEYGDIFDRMGSAQAPQGHFNHFAKNRLDWLPDSRVAEATMDGTFRLYRFDHRDALDNPTLAVKVPVDGATNYWIAYRQLFTSSSYNLSEAAYVVAENLSQNSETNLIDCTPGSASPESEDRKDAGLEIGTPFVTGGVTFSALARGGSFPDEWIDVRHRLHPPRRPGPVHPRDRRGRRDGLAYRPAPVQFQRGGHRRLRHQ